MPQFHTILGPAAWASALINNDWSGVPEEEIPLAKRYQDGREFIDCAEESHFCYVCDLLFDVPWSGGEVIEYTILDRSAPDNPDPQGIPL